MTVRDELLVDVTTLAAELARPNPPTVLDVRWRLGGPPAVADHVAGHLPGAAFLDLDVDLCGVPGEGGRHPLPDPDRLAGALRRVGVRTGHPVVVYDAGNGMSAARTWWTLRWAGHSSVRVLDGGYAAWLAAGGAVSTDPPVPHSGDLEVRPGCLPVLDAAEAARLASAGAAAGGAAAGGAATGGAATGGAATAGGAAEGGSGGVLIDVRAADRFRGENESIDRLAGRIPGAVNLPTTSHSDPDGRFRGDDEIAAAFAAVGVAPGRPVGAYCGSGVTAAHTILALHLIGRTDAALYVGSWSHWITDPARPVATGAPGVG